MDIIEELFLDNRSKFPDTPEWDFKQILELGYKAKQEFHAAEINRYQKAIKAQEKRCIALRELTVEAKQSQEVDWDEALKPICNKMYDHVFEEYRIWLKQNYNLYKK